MDGKDVTVFTTGSILEEVMDAANVLTESGISMTVVNVAAVKPFSEEVLLCKRKNTKLFVTVEEHNVQGGLGSIVAEILKEHGVEKRLLRIGLHDMFAEGYSNNQKALRKQNHLDAEGIAQNIAEALR